MDADATNNHAIIVISDSDSDLEDEEQGSTRRQQLIAFSNSPSPLPPVGLAPGEGDYELGPVQGVPSDREVSDPMNDLVWNDYMQDGGLNDANDLYNNAPDVAEQQAMLEDINHRNAAHIFLGPAAGQHDDIAPLATATKDECIHAIIELFPDICHTYVFGLYDTVSVNQEVLITHILDKVSYPKAKDIQKSLKRKRALDADEEAAKKYTALNREVGPRIFIREILSNEFVDIPVTFVDACLTQSGGALFPAYRVLEEAHRTWDRSRPAYKKLVRPRKRNNNYDGHVLESRIAQGSTLPENMVLRELQAAQRVRRKAEAKRDEKLQAELAETENLAKAIAEGTMLECGCCFDDHPLNRMVHCNNDDQIHWFCRKCARQNAETEIGESRYLLKCMSMDSCEAGFSLEQRAMFLDDKTTIALERIHQESELRMAGIENLASCPFCTYAAEYPPIEEDREFRCQKPDCEKVSCRLCNMESHIPKNCEEHAKDSGLSVRRQIEEAMSQALIRRCNKCNTPFIKTEGCNKMTCTQPGCGNIQCYICSKSCGYEHFNDTRRGGKQGNCPLFDQAGVESRHNDEIERAKEVARAKVMAEHPEYTEEDLEIKLSAEAMADEVRRKQVPQARGIQGLFRMEEMNRLLNLPYQVPPGANRHVPPRALGGAAPPYVGEGLNPYYVPALAPYQPPHLPPPPGPNRTFEALQNQQPMDAFAENPPYHPPSPQHQAFPVPADHNNRRNHRRERMIPVAQGSPQGHDAHFRELQRLNERAVMLQPRNQPPRPPPIIPNLVGSNQPVMGHPGQVQPPAIDPAAPQFPLHFFNANAMGGGVEMDELAPPGRGFLNNEHFAQWPADDRELEH